ncbi:replicative DNA helicase [Gynuella sunshinyii]|uniref:Replicative DNA helicase n=1 Tax=Gynuella sunshinyii YC6258 TaxID=1445510 RepID=A0A0C5V4G0_9GAMM|nr:replicative DNA helicase [Gynuella sunshinyii]AJQ94365.1 replicative DNA helicase [Gynuella sunshinyii YC6258]
MPDSNSLPNNDLFSDTDELSQIKVPPHSIEAEQSVLGALLLDNNQWDNVSEIITAEDFYQQPHRLIFRVMEKLAGQAQPFDVVTVGNDLERDNDLDKVGGRVFLADLAEQAPSISNVVAYSQIIHERSVQRRLIQAANEIAAAAYEPKGRNAETLLDEAERTVFKIAEDRPNEGGLVGVNPLLKKSVAKIQQLFESDSPLTGITTGFTGLDRRTSGFNPGDLVIVAARPSMGKTTFAMNLVEAAVMAQDQPVLVFSLEMPADQLVTRMLSSLGRIDQTKVRTGKLEPDDWPKLTMAVNMLNSRPLFIDDTAGISPTEMRSRIRRLVREHGNPALVMVDYLQLMKIKGFTEGRTNEISEISRSLKSIAKEFECPMIALSQLNRSLEQRPNKRPVNSDLRESGAIEQDADIILFIYRDEVYNEDSPDKGIAEIITGKQRNGPIGTDRLAFIGKYTRFEDLAPEYQSSYDE